MKCQRPKFVHFVGVLSMVVVLALTSCLQATSYYCAKSHKILQTFTITSCTSYTKVGQSQICTADTTTYYHYTIEECDQWIKSK